MHPSIRHSEDIDFFQSPQLGLKTGISVGRNYIMGSNAKMVHLLYSNFHRAQYNRCLSPMGKGKQNIAKQDKVGECNKECHGEHSSQGKLLEYFTKSNAHEYDPSLKIHKSE
ncbi:uncharacterized protein Bfra_009489 [Botrytis fragariae]|uniref:Uncharacterized protein n=1 Tax=Botrytis fragariae TaxID=1964551 RepID=A0A8H6APE1_9HELO|nr:uncharacterized protein Bfra_009489 [Botrytis fragariae]KAF5870935.1 hypothetical protein Bfra_009489 [Botrytis fragariae]